MALYRHEWIVNPEELPRLLFVTVLTTGEPATNATKEELTREVLRLADENGKLRLENDLLLGRIQEDRPWERARKGGLTMSKLTSDEILWCEWVQAMPETEIARHEQASALSLCGFLGGLRAERDRLRSLLERLEAAMDHSLAAWESHRPVRTENGPTATFSGAQSALADLRRELGEG